MKRDWAQIGAVIAGLALAFSILVAPFSWPRVQEWFGLGPTANAAEEAKDVTPSKVSANSNIINSVVVNGNNSGTINYGVTNIELRAAINASSDQWKTQLPYISEKINDELKRAGKVELSNAEIEEIFHRLRSRNPVEVDIGRSFVDQIISFEQKVEQRARSLRNIILSEPKLKMSNFPIRQFSNIRGAGSLGKFENLPNDLVIYGRDVQLVARLMMENVQCPEDRLRSMQKYRVFVCTPIFAHSLAKEGWIDFKYYNEAGELLFAESWNIIPYQLTLQNTQNIYIDSIEPYAFDFKSSNYFTLRIKTRKIKPNQAEEVVGKITDSLDRLECYKSSINIFNCRKKGPAHDGDIIMDFSTEKTGKHIASNQFRIVDSK